MAAATSAQLRFLTDAAHLMRQTAPRTSAYLMSRRLDLASTSQAAALASGTTPALASPQIDNQRQRVCTSCGLILVPGRDGTTLRIQPGRPVAKSQKTKQLQGKRGRNGKQRRLETDVNPIEATSDVETPAKLSRLSVTRTGITKVFVCGLCSRETRVALPPPPPLLKQRKHKIAAEARVSDERFASVAAKSEPVAEAPNAQSTAPVPSADPTRPLTLTPVKASNNANSKKRAKSRKAGLLALLDKSRAKDNSDVNLNFTFDDFRIN
ncbi:hypothetical protein SEPCBS119000_004402 [Sporothrix epigloea]|uniref:Uncharacterized protein n=1 Tax=Sporothrix epigloea TaxID=1892477 RepID=A0ABP0DVN4_9PEZI